MNIHISTALKHLLKHAPSDHHFDAVLQAARVFAGKAEESDMGMLCEGTFKFADGSVLYVELPECSRRRLGLPE